MKRLSLPIVMTAFLVFSAVSPLRAKPAELVKVSSSESGLTIRFTLGDYTLRPTDALGGGYVSVRAAGLSSTAEPGMPDLPMASTLVAVPEGMIAEVSIRERAGSTRGPLEVLPFPVLKPLSPGEETVFPKERLELEPGFYGSGRVYPGELVSTAQAGRLRGIEVVALHVHPFRYDAGRHLLEITDKLLIDVSFKGAGGAGRMGSRRGFSGEPSEFDRALRRSIINFSDVLRIRRPARPVRVRLSPGVSNPEVKVKVRSTGLHRLPFSALPAGWGQSVPADQVVLYERHYEADSTEVFAETRVPCRVFDTDSDGVFSGSDYIVFYGLSFEDRYRREPNFTEANTYWLSWDASGRKDFEDAKAWYGVNGLTPPVSFPDTLHVEEDRYVKPNPRSGDNYYFFVSPIAPGPYRSFEYDFSLPPADSGLIRLRASFEGGAVGSELKVGLLSPGGDSLGAGGLTLDVSQVKLFESTFHLSSPSGSSTPWGFFFTAGEINYSYAYFDWFEVVFERLYEAPGGYLAFQSPPGPGVVQLEVDSVPESLVYVCDVTDPFAVRFLDPNGFRTDRSGAAYTITFQDSVSSVRKYVLAAPGSLLQVGPEDTELAGTDFSSFLPGQDVDYIIIIPDETYRTPVAPLESLRRGNGLTVRTVTKEEVYDAFGGGIPSDVALKSFVTYAYRHWGTSFVLLFGDANLDHKGVYVGAGMDLIPTHERRVSVGQAELAGSDYWYTTTDGELDRYGDLYIGRIPAGSVEEARSMVAKITAYESYSASDTWRRRMVFLADDAYSSGTLWGGSYGYNSSEDEFEDSSDSMAALVAGTMDGLMDIEKFYLSTYTGPFHVRHGDSTQTAAVQFIDDSLVVPRPGGRLVSPKEYFYEIVGKGALFLNFQGHGSRSVFTHEYIVNEYEHESSCATALEEGECFDNVGMPFILLAFGCHMGDFDSEVEGKPTATDAVAEKILLNPDAGAIASYASGAYELLGNNVKLNQMIVEATFADLPDTNLQGVKVEPRWILGELVTAGELKSVAAGNYRPVFNHALLGDPGLKIDAGGPRIVVSVDGDSVETGFELTSKGGGDSVTVVAWASDEVRIDTVWVESQGVRVAEDDFSVVSLGGPARKKLTYGFSVLPGNYDVVIKAVDGNGRLVEFSLAVRTRVVFRVSTEGKPISPGDVLGTSLPIRMSITGPVPVSAGDIVVKLDAVDITGKFQFSRVDQYGRSWEVSSLEALEVSPGRHTLSVLMKGREVGSIEFTSVATLRITNVANYPNPFSSGTTIFFNLNKPVEEAGVDIYSASGRKVAVLDLVDPQVGYNEVRWLGEDDTGEKVSSGVYFYKVWALSSDGERKEHTGKMARIRGLTE